MDRNSIQCVGRPSEVASKVNETETGPIKPTCATSADPLAKESVEWKPKQKTPKPSGKVEGQNPSINSDTSNPMVKAQSYKRQQKAKSIGKTERQDSSTSSNTTNPTQESESSHRQQKAKSIGKTERQDSSTNSDTTNHESERSHRQQKAKSIGKTERQDSSTNSNTTNPTQESESSHSGGYNATKAPSFKNATTYGHKQVPPVITEQQTTSEVKLDGRHELQIHPHVVLSKSDPGPHVEECEEEESEEPETAEGHVPLELFAEFLQAVMTKNYQLAKKLCQMILIYEPQNSEAKSFLPLIEEKLLIEIEECSDNNDDESDTSDDDDEEEEENDSSDDEDVDDDESSDSCDTDEESTDSADDTSSAALREEKA